MGMFDALRFAGSGMTVNRTWLDALSDNVSNANDVSRTSEDAFKERFVQVAAVEGGGVEVQSIQYGSGQGTIVHDPNHPLADANGNVKHTEVDMATQMTSMMMAQRGYQANVASISRAREAYEAAISIGRS